MKFRFCGGQDAPDWLLTEIATISEVDEKVVRKLVDIVMRDLVERSFEKAAALKAAGKTLSESALKACISGLNFILTNAAKHDVESSVLITEIQQLGLPRALSEIIEESFTANKEAAQDTFRESGLRCVLNEWHCIGFVLARVCYVEYSGRELRTSCVCFSYCRLPRMESLDYRVDMILDSSSAQDVNEPSVELTIGLSDVVDTSMTARSESKVRAFRVLNSKCCGRELFVPNALAPVYTVRHRQDDRTISFELSANKFRVLHSELSNARRMMDALSNAN